MNYFHKSRYFELVAKDKNLKLKNNSLYNENRSEYQELVSYQIILEEQVFYENRFQYIDLIKKYIDGKINCYTFQWDFFDLHRSHSKILDNLIENLNQSAISNEVSELGKLKGFQSIDNWSYPIISLGFLFLTIKIISGGVWANEAWVLYWSWDPKETWALIPWLIFATYLYVRISKGWEGPILGGSSNISFSKDSKMENFSLIVEELFPLCDALDDGLTEDRFDLEIKKIYSKMEK